MLDPNCRPGAIDDRAAYLGRIGHIAARADVVKASVDDLAYLYPGLPPAEAAEVLLTAGSALVLVTDGPRPARAFLPGAVLAVEVPAVDIVDTIGAGDAFGGGFLRLVVVERPHPVRPEAGSPGPDRTAVQAAAAVAAATCARPGADPPTLADLRASHAWPPTSLRPLQRAPQASSVARAPSGSGRDLGVVRGVALAHHRGVAADADGDGARYRDPVQQPGAHRRSRRPRSAGWPGCPRSRCHRRAASSGPCSPAG